MNESMFIVFGGGHMSSLQITLITLRELTVASSVDIREASLALVGTLHPSSILSNSGLMALRCFNTGKMWITSVVSCLAVARFMLLEINCKVI